MGWWLLWVSTEMTRFNVCERHHQQARTDERMRPTEKDLT